MFLMAGGSGNRALFMLPEMERGNVYGAHSKNSCGTSYLNSA